MASFFKYFILCSLLLLTSCQEGGEAGDLFGQWRRTGSDTQYLCFSGSVVLFNNLAAGQVFGNFQRTGDSLFIQCVSIDGIPADTANVENSYGFKPFADIRLQIVTLDADQLILSKDGQTWSFYKY